MHESATPEKSTPESRWALSSDSPPLMAPEAESDFPNPQLDTRGQCLLFCNQCGQASNGGSEFCLRCGAKRCVNCGE